MILIWLLLALLVVLVVGTFVHGTWEVHDNNRALSTLVSWILTIVLVILSVIQTQRLGRLKIIREKYPEWKIESNWHAGKEVVVSSGPITKVLLLEEVIMERYR